MATTNGDENPWGLSTLGQAAAAGEAALDVDVLRDDWNEKTNPNGFVNLGVAENSLMHETMAEYVEKNTRYSPRLLTYGEGGAGTARLQAAVAAFLTRKLKPARFLTSEHVVITNGCSSAIEHCSFLLSNPGDGILLGQPYYCTFMADIQFRPKARVVPVPFKSVDPMSFDAVSCYEEAIASAKSAGISLKALIICHPHNPLGRCYPPSVIKALMKLCQEHKLHFISDEIYAMSTWHNEVDAGPPAPEPFISALSIDTNGVIDPHRVHVLWGFSKDFGANGLRIGTVISQANPGFIKALQVVSLYSYPSSLADNIAATILEDFEFTDRFFAENTKKLSTAYALTVKFLKKHNINYMPGANAAFFVWVDLGTAWADRNSKDAAEADDKCVAIYTKLMKKKLYMADGKSFGTEKDGWFRIVFAQREDYVLEGLKRMVAALEESSQSLPLR